MINTGTSAINRGNVQEGRPIASTAARRIASIAEFLKSETIENAIKPVTANETRRISQIGINMVQLLSDQERFASSTTMGTKTITERPHARP